MRNTHLRRLVLCAALAALAALAATPAWAKEGWYVSIKGGIGGGADIEVPSITGGSLTLDAEIGPAVMGAVGYAIGNGMRIEGEISWRKNDVDTDGVVLITNLGNFPFEANTENLAFMFNGAYDFQVDAPVTPYIIGGIGISLVEGELEIAGVSGDADDTVFAYQGGAGLSWHITEHVALDVSYRFFGTTEPDLLSGGNNSSINNTHHNGLAGLTFSF